MKRTNCKVPKVSIGMPVYNGERYIRQALDSLLMQESQDFELIISDNASTDGTQEICLVYAARDERIRYYRNQVNMGMTWNFNRVFDLATADFFMWAAHDDYRDPRCIRMCLKAFEIAENVVLVGSHYQVIDHKTEGVFCTNYGFTTIGLSTYEKFKFVIACFTNNKAGMVYGIFRTSALRKFMPIKKVYGADSLLLNELCLIGEFITVPEILMYERSGGTYSDLMRLYRTEFTGNSLFRIDPYFDYVINVGRIIFRTDKLNRVEKIRLIPHIVVDYCYFIVLHVGPWLYRKLLAIWPGAALSARDLWRWIEKRRKLGGGAGIKY